MRRALLLLIAALVTIAATSTCTSFDAPPHRSARVAARGPGQTNGPLAIGRGPAVSPPSPQKLLSSANFAAQSTGIATLPSSLSASITTGQCWDTYSSAAGSGLGCTATTNVAVVGHRTASVQGVEIDGGTTNLVPLPGVIQAGTSNTYWYQLGGSITTGYSGPNGTTSASHIAVTSGVQSTEVVNSTILDDLSARFTYSVWYLAGATSTVQGNGYISNGACFSGLSSSAWGRYSWNAKPGVSYQRIIPVDGTNLSSHGGCAAAAYDVYAALPQVERRPLSRFTSTTRAPLRLYDTATSASLRGRIRFTTTWSPSLLASDYTGDSLQTAGIWSTGISSTVYPSWGQLRLPLLAVAGDQNNALYLDPYHVALVAVVDGVQARSAPLPTWAVGDTFSFDVTFGAGATVGTYVYTPSGGSAGASTSLAFTTTVLPSARWTAPAGQTPVALDLFSDSATGWTAEGTIGSYAIYDAGPAATPPDTYYASPAGSGTSCTAAAPCSLAGALTQAQAVLPQPSGVVQIVLRAGTYRLASTLALTGSQNGLAIVNYPGERPIVSGHTLLTGTWTLDSGSVYKLSGVSSLDPIGGQVVLNGYRLGLATLAIADSASWRIDGTSGFAVTSADATTLAALARPQDVYLEWVGGSGGASWRHGWVGVDAPATPSTTIASGSNGVALPTGTISVASTVGFPNAGSFTISALSATVTCSGTSGGNSFTGCTGGSGTLATGQAVTGTAPTELVAWGNGLTWALSAVGSGNHGTYNPAASGFINGLNAREWVGANQYYWNSATGTLYYGAPTSWTASTQYQLGAPAPSGSSPVDQRAGRRGPQVLNGANIYGLVRGGYSAASGGPTGTGSAAACPAASMTNCVLDGTVIWQWLSTVTTPTVEVPSFDALVTITSASNITLAGLTFEGSAWTTSANAPMANGGYADAYGGQNGINGDVFGGTGAYIEQPAAIQISGAGATGNTIRGCTIRRMAAAGVSLLNGAQGNTLTGNRFDDLGGVGVWMGDVTLAAAHQATASLLVGSNSATYNYVTRIGKRWVASCGIFRGYTVGDTISWNTVVEPGYGGICDGTGWGTIIASPASNSGGVTITGNLLLRGPTMGYLETQGSVDGTALYTSATEGTQGLVSYNYIETVDSAGFYVDNGAYNTLYTYNVVGPSTFTGYYATVNDYNGNTTAGITNAHGNTLVDNYAPYNATKCLTYPNPTHNTIGTNFACTNGPSPFPGANTGPTSAAAITAAAGMRVAAAPANDYAIGGIGALILAAAAVARRRAMNDRARRAA